ncbi:unnamed protein product [Peniophora sp. CBMAI 1063]|nr:unnamed protein product [Peniophora sp. CBMAI 1063]
MSSVPSLDDDAASRTLTELGWKRCERLGKLEMFCNAHFNVPLESPQELEAWPAWQEVLSGPAKHQPTIDAATKLSIISDCDNTALPSTPFYSMGDGTFSALDQTNNRIAVRKEHARLYDDIARWGKSAVVTGQPSSGKTYFIYYCLLMRLSLGKPVLFSPTPKQWFLFAQCGAWSATTTSVERRLNDNTRHKYREILTCDTWALVDDDNRRNKGPDPYLWRNPLEIPTIVASRPIAGRYDGWLRSNDPPLLKIVEPASFGELVQGFRLLHEEPGRRRFRAPPNAKSAFEDLLHSMKVFGRSENNCLRSFKVPNKETENSVRQHISQIDFTTLQKIFNSLKRTPQDAPSSLSVDVLFELDSDETYMMALNSITIVSPREPDQQSDVAVNDRVGLDIASKWIFRQLLIVFHLKNPERARDFLNICTLYPQTKAMAGHFFEDVIHVIFSDARSDWKSRCTLTEFFPCDKSRHTDRNRFPLRLEHIFQERKLEVYSGPAPKFDPTRYLKPLAKNNATFDSIVYAIESSASPNEEAPEHEGPARPLPPAPPTPQKTRYRLRQPKIPKSRTLSTKPGSSARPTAPASVLHASRSAEVPFSGSPSPPASTVKGKARARDEPAIQERPRKAARMEVPDPVKHCVAMQMTVGKSHTWNTTGVQELRGTFEEDGNWHFVIVTHKTSDLDILTLGNSVKWNQYAPYFRWYQCTIDLAGSPWEDVDYIREGMELNVDD